MLYTISVRDQSCPRKECKFFGKVLQGNVISHAKTYPRFKCKDCGKTWVAGRNEITFGLKSSKEKFKTVSDCLGEGISIRKIAQIAEISPATVMRWKEKIKA